MQNENKQKTSPDEYLFSEKLWKNALNVIFFLCILGGTLYGTTLGDPPSTSSIIVGGITGCIIGFINVGLISIMLTISKNISRIADSIAYKND